MNSVGKNILFRSAKSQLHIYCVIFMIFWLPNNSFAQFKNKINDATAAKIKDTTLISDTNDTARKFIETPINNKFENWGIKISPDALEDVVEATATDSAVMDVKTNNFRLYGDAKVNYDGKKLAADQIDFDQENNIATATEIIDTNNKKQEKPTFEQGQEKVFYEALQYNFKTQRAIIRNARSQYGEGFVKSEQIKRNADQSLYGYKNVYTTCALEHPHFGIRTNKIKIIPEQAIAMGSANIEIEGVPTPIFLPFGYFPTNNEKHRSGFILPRYIVEQQRGLGLLDGGYYFNFNDNIDLMTQANIFTKGSFGITLTSNYVQRYKYSGRAQFSYSLNKTGEEFDPAASIIKTFAINWSHFKDAKSLPGVNFNAKVEVQKGNFYALNSFNTNQVLQNQFQSNITFSKNWIGKPYSLTVSALHRQDINTKLMSITLPDINFYVNPQTLFARRVPVGATKWFEKITVGYSLHALNRLDFYDTAFQINGLNFSDMQNGMVHNIPISASYNVLRHITLSVGANYNEYWNTKKIYQAYNDATNKVDSSIENGFATSRDFNANFSLNTQIYGMMLFKKGKIRGFRHVIRPTVGMSFRPDFAKNPFNYYYQTRLDSSAKETYVSPYTGSIVGFPTQGRNGSVDFRLNNNLQMKVRNKKDTAKGFKNIVLLDRLDFNTAYNLAVDSFQWSPYVFTASTTIANLLNINASANFDPYQFDYINNRRSTRTMLAAENKFGRLTAANIGFGTSFRSKQKANQKDQSDKANSDDYKSLMRNNGYNNYVDFNIPWTLNLTYSLNLTKTPSIYSKSDTSVLTQNFTFSGDFNFTPRWKLGFNSGYDFVNKQLTYTSLNIYRDLHCWEMRLGLIPFGFRKSFTFSLNVKAQVLQDLKLTRQRSFFDAVQ